MKVYTEEELNSLERDQLLEIAGEFNVEQSGRGSVIIKNILEAQSKLASSEDPTTPPEDPNGSNQNPPEDPAVQSQKDDQSSPDEPAESNESAGGKYKYSTKSGQAITLAGKVVHPVQYTDELDPFLENWVGTFIIRETLA